MGVGAGLCMYDVVVANFTFAISSPDKFFGNCYLRQEDMFSSLFVCLSLSITSERIGIFPGPVNIRLNSGGDLCHRLDTGIVFQIRH